MSSLWGREPTMIVSFIGALLVLGVSFGLHLTDQQKAAILAVVPLLCGLLTRTQVTAPATLARKFASRVPPLPMLLLTFVFVLSLVGCAAAKAALGGALSVEQLACVLAQDELGAGEPPIIAGICAIPPSLIAEVAGAVLARKRGHALALAAKASK